MTTSLPKELQSLHPPLKAFHSEGDLSLLTRQKISIVGSRKTLQYSKTAITQLASALHKRGVVTVSGGAMGIDAAAHFGAKELTIAVMANGVDIIYPKVNKVLLEDIKKRALMISEYEAGFKATKYTFVHRNRIVVALGEALIVGEADIGSGTMHSVEYAKKMNKPIYVLAHRMGESLATQQLLEEGSATLITDIDAFVEMFANNAPLEDVHTNKEDDFMVFCKTSPTYDEAVAIDAQRLFELELNGEVSIVNGRIRFN